MLIWMCRYLWTFVLLCGLFLLLLVSIREIRRYESSVLQRQFCLWPIGVLQANGSVWI